MQGNKHEDREAGGLAATTRMYGSRRLDGHLTKKGGAHWKRRWFTLEDHVITYFSKQGDLLPRGRMVLIPESRVASLPTRARAFQVITNGKPLIVAADSAEDRERWVAALAKEIQGLKERARKRRSGPSVRAVKAAGTVFELDPKYEIIKPIGHGSSGVVISALNKKSNSKVAIKKIHGAFDDLANTKRVITEIRLLRHFDHENIIKVVDILPPSSLEDFDDVYLVCELMETDLHRVIYSRQRLTDEHTQYFLYHILCALKYIHSASVLHRDLKPSNVLLNANCDLKLCDFGLSRGLQDNHKTVDLTEYVVTRWYRAPEIMLSVRNYDAAIDVWSVGCILGEMLNRRPLYAGNHYLQQLKLIAALVGKPTESDIRFVTHPKARRFMLGLPDTPPADLGVKFPDAHPDAVDLLSKMLVLDPHRRISVEQALEHPYLASLHDVALEPTAEGHVDFRSIERVEPTKQNLRLMVLEDVLHFHPECKDRFEPALDTARAMAAPVSAERGCARAPRSPTGSPTGVTTATTTTTTGNGGRAASPMKEAAAAGYLPPPPVAKPPASAAATQDFLPAIAEEGVQERRLQQTMQEVEAGRAPVAADAPESTKTKRSAGKDDAGSREESAWPPEERVGQVFGDRPRRAGRSGDGDPEEREGQMQRKEHTTTSETRNTLVPGYPAGEGFEAGRGHEARVANYIQGSGDVSIGRSLEEHLPQACDAEERVANISGEAMGLDGHDLKTPNEEAVLSRGLDNQSPSPSKSILAARDAILTTSLGPGAATYVSRTHAVELELQAGSLDEEIPLAVNITQGLAFVDCGTGELKRAPFCDDAEEFLAMTFVHGPEGVSFPRDKPAKLRFFLGCVDELVPTRDGADQVVITDEEIERDILASYRPLSSPDGVQNWTTLGAYAVVFRRLLGQREVWVETRVNHFFSVTANAKKVDKGGENQPYFCGDLGGLRWWFTGRLSAPRVRFGNTTKDSCATFTYYPIVQHTEASSDSELHGRTGATEGTLGGGRRNAALPAAGDKLTAIVDVGTYEDCDLSCYVNGHSQMHVRVGILQDLTGRGLKSRGRLQLLDVKTISGDKILVLREPRLGRPAQHPGIDWPCTAQDICKL